MLAPFSLPTVTYGIAFFFLVRGLFCLPRFISDKNQVWRSVSSIQDSEFFWLGTFRNLKDAFFDVVDIEEKLHLARGLAEFRDVINEILLHLVRQIT
jgi:hypothetical protein